MKFISNSQQEPRIEVLQELHLLGKSIRTNLDENRTFELWSNFMPYVVAYKKQNGIRELDLFSIEVFDPGQDFSRFRLKTFFMKWAALQKSDTFSTPDEFDEIVIPEGKYAVFLHKGLASLFSETLNFIHAKWLPNSEFKLDDRPHFEIMGDKYFGPEHPDSIEEVWVPISLK